MIKKKFQEFYFLPILILIYSSIAIPTRILCDKKEFFPFFAWTLYTKTPSVTYRPTIKILELNSQKLDKPIDLYDVYFSYGYTYQSLKNELDSFYKAFLDGDSSLKLQQLNKLRDKMRSRGVNSFQIVLESYYPYEKLVNGINLEVQPLTDQVQV